MWGPIKVWLLVVTTAYQNPHVEPQYYYSQADCRRVEQAMRYEANSPAFVRCVYTTIFVQKK